MTAADQAMEVDEPVHALQVKYDEAEAISENLPDKAIGEFECILKYGIQHEKGWVFS